MSKTYYNLYDKICHPLNLWWAYKAAARGKRYQPAAAFFEYDLEKNLIEMERSNEYEQQYRLSLCPITSNPCFLLPECAGLQQPRTRA